MRVICMRIAMTEPLARTRLLEEIPWSFDTRTLSGDVREDEH